MRVDVDAAQHQLLVFRDDARQVVDDAQVVVAYHPECYLILRRSLSAPLGLDDAVAEASTHLGRIGAVGAVNLDASADGDESEDVVAVDGVAAVSQLVVYALQVLAYDEHVAVGPGRLSGGLRRVEHELLGRAHVGCRCFLALLQLQVFVDDGAHVECAVGQLAVEVTGLLVAQLLDGAHHDRLLQLNLPVVELALQHLLHQQCLLLLRLLQCQPYLRFCPRRLHYREPLLLGPLCG